MWIFYGKYKHLITVNHPDAYLRFTLKLKFCDARVVKYQKQSSRRRRVLALWPPVASDTVASVPLPTYTSPPSFPPSPSLCFPPIHPLEPQNCPFKVFLSSLSFLLSLAKHSIFYQTYFVRMSAQHFFSLPSHLVSSCDVTGGMVYTI